MSHFSEIGSCKKNLTAVRIQELPQVTVPLVNWDMVKRDMKLGRRKKNAASKTHTHKISVYKFREVSVLASARLQVLPLDFLFHKRRSIYQLIFQSRLGTKVICN